NKFNEWGAVILAMMGPLGWLINTIIILKNNWDSIVAAFKNDGILGGLKRIGIVLLDVVLYPIQQLLEMLAKIPGLSKLAGSGAQKLSDIREKLNLVTPPGEKTEKEKSGVVTPEDLMNEALKKDAADSKNKAS